MSRAKKRKRRRGAVGLPAPGQQPRQAPTLAQETEVPEHVAPVVAKQGESVTMNIEAGVGEVAVHLGALTESVVLSPSDARQMSKALLKAALAAEAKAVERAAELVGPEMAMQILEKRLEQRKLEPGAAVPESEEPS